MYNWTVFIPRITWPTWDNMLLADTTRANAGNLVSSCSCGLHFLSSDRSTFVPNLKEKFIPIHTVYYKIIWYFQKIFQYLNIFLSPMPLTEPESGPPFFRRTLLVEESFESESDKFEIWFPPRSCSSCSSNPNIQINYAISILSDLANTASMTDLETFLKAGGLVLSILRYSGMRSVWYASPSPTTLRICVLVGSLLHLRANFDRVLWIRLDEGFGRKEAKVYKICQLINNFTLPIMSQASRIIFTQFKSSSHSTYNGYRMFKAEFLELRTEGILLVFQVNRRCRR